MLAIGTVPPSGFFARNSCRLTLPPSFLKCSTSSSCCLCMPGEPLGRGPSAQSCFEVAVGPQRVERILGRRRLARLPPRPAARQCVVRQHADERGRQQCQHRSAVIVRCCMRSF